MNKKDPLVSVIIPMYNSGAYVADCINSCQRQTFQNLEIIVVDDGSTDNGYDVVEKLAKKDSRIVLIRKENGGVSSARNVGIERSNGKYVCFIDADDYIESVYVENMLRIMIDEKADFCIGKNGWVDGINNFDNTNRIVTPDEAVSILLDIDMPIASGNKMYDGDLIRKQRYRDDLFYGEGFYFVTDFAKKAKKIIYTNLSLYHYRKVNPNSATTAFSMAKRINGEKALQEMRRNIYHLGAHAKKAWNVHYGIFCANTVLMMVKCNSCSREEKRQWRGRVRSVALSAVINIRGYKRKIKIITASWFLFLYKIIAIRRRGL